MTKSFLVGLFLTSLFLAGCGANRDSSAASTKIVPAHFSNVADARPLPAVLDPKQFSQPSVVKAYRYAKENPEIFSQQPCYCNCDNNNGHRSLLDCFATDHGAT
jgi:hypothetical protein